MRRGGLLHGEITALITCMGHTDELVIADAGLPIPPGVKCIDLALCPGVPSFQATLATLLEEFVCQGAWLAEEITQHNPQVSQVLEILGELPVQYLSHQAFKERCQRAQAVIRTGECSPYANVILQAGVFF